MFRRTWVAVVAAFVAVLFTFTTSASAYNAGGANKASGYQVPAPVNVWTAMHQLPQAPAPSTQPIGSTPSVPVTNPVTTAPSPYGCAYDTASWLVTMLQFLNKLPYAVTQSVCTTHTSSTTVLPSGITSTTVVDYTLSVHVDGAGHAAVLGFRNTLTTDSAQQFSSLTENLTWKALDPGQPWTNTAEASEGGLAPGDNFTYFAFGQWGNGVPAGWAIN